MIGLYIDNYLCWHILTYLGTKQHHFIENEHKNFYKKKHPFYFLMSVFSIIVKSCMAKQSGIQNTNFLDKKNIFNSRLLKVRKHFTEFCTQIKSWKIKAKLKPVIHPLYPIIPMLKPTVKTLNNSSSQFII